MNVSIEYINDVKARLTINVVKDDYTEKVQKLLVNYRKNLSLPGFRKGNVPKSLVEKKYGVGAKVEVVNELVGEELVKYIQENKLDVLGDPVQSEDFQPYDFSTVEDFKFDFDLAIAPKIEVSLDKNDSIDYYKIEPTAEMIDNQIQSLRESFGEMGEVDTIEDNDFVKGLLVELDGDRPKEGGLIKNDASFIPKYLKDENAKSEFIGKGKNTVIVFTPYSAMGENEAEISSFFGIEKDKVSDYKDTQFSFEIHSISRRFPAKLNEDLYKKAFGENTNVQTENDLRAEVKGEFERLFVESSDSKFYSDLEEVVKSKVGKPEFAKDVLKRFLLNKSKDTKEAEINESMDNMLSNLSLDLARRNILKSNNTRDVTKEDIEIIAKEDIRRQFAQYGMSHVPDDMLASYLKKTLENKDAISHYSQLAERRIFIELAKTLVTIVEKNVTTEEFSKIMEKKK